MVWSSSSEEETSSVTAWISSQTSWTFAVGRFGRGIARSLMSGGRVMSISSRSPIRIGPVTRPASVSPAERTTFARKIIPIGQ